MGREKFDVADPLDSQLRRIQRRKSVLAQIRCLLAAAAAVYLLFGVIFGVSAVSGDSMAPTLHSGDIVLFYRLQRTYYLNDIVLIEREGGGSDYIKRVVGLPGQTVGIDRNAWKLTINGATVSEPLIYEKTIPKTGCEFPLTLGENEYFVLGDHRENSVDSRNFGAVGSDRFHGVVLAVLRLGT